MTKNLNDRLNLDQRWLYLEINRQMEIQIPESSDEQRLDGLPRPELEAGRRRVTGDSNPGGGGGAIRRFPLILYFFQVINE